MDLEDEGWVNIPYDGLLEFHDGGDDEIFSRKYVKNPERLFKPNYFNTPQMSQITEEPRLWDHKEEVKEIIKLPTVITQSRETSTELEPEPEPELDQQQSNQDPIFQVFFKKENQFVEIKIDSPRLSSRESDLSRIETSPFQYEEKGGDHVVNCSSPPKMIKEEVVVWKERLNFWKWGLSGIGVFCSVGMAAATICIIICGNGKRHKQQNQKLRIQIYPENKRIKQVVEKANAAMSAVRGVPLVKAEITYGGNYIYESI